MTAKSLYRLTRAPPNQEEFVALFEMLTNEETPDSVVVMVATAILDHSLRDALFAELPNKAAADRLFGEQGPLRDLSAKIKLAHAMGLIDDNEAKDLEGVRHIRNAFAHAARRVTFETPEIADMVDGLHKWRDADPTTYDPEEDGPPDDQMSRKQLFGGLIYLFSIKLSITEEGWRHFRQGVNAFVFRWRLAWDSFEDILLDQFAPGTPN